jgi:crotonobetainyl-CoA:carnitine CoA-transferase CaiB-like acyl-CoA transferase
VREKPLNGVTVVDVSSYVTGGFATAMLANQGAEVIKIERPGGGDPTRQFGPPFVRGESGYFMTVNYGKRSVELDLKSEEGKEVIYDLLSDADVFVENVRGSADSLGLGWEGLREHNPKLVYCSISAFGDSGPWSGRPGFDLLLQGLTGIMSVTGEADGPPAKVGLPQTDLMTAMWAAFGVVNALLRRERTGRGDRVDVAMFDAAIPWLTKQAGKAMEGEEPKRMGTKDPVVAPYQAFEARDGYLVCGAPNQTMWKALCEALDRPDLYEDDRFEDNAKRVENVDQLEAELEATFRERDVDEWLTVLVDEYELPAGPVNGVPEAIESEQARERELVRDLNHSTIGEYPVLEHPLRYEDATAGFTKHAPALGEFSDEVLRERGYSEESISRLREAGVIGSGS